VEFRALLYVPGMLPFELGSNMFDENTGNIRLYVKRVFINDKFTELCPRWLKFVKGVVDSEDLPLNVGREILQKSSVLRVVSRRIVKKCLDMFDDLLDKGGEDWGTFQKQFGKYLKVCARKLPWAHACGVGGEGGGLRGGSERDPAG